MMNYEPEKMDQIHAYLLTLKEPKIMPLWEVEKAAEKYRVKQIYLDSREKQKQMQQTREEYDIAKILKEAGK